MIILRWLINTLALLFVSELVPGFVIDNLFSALIAALILGLVNAVVRPIIILLTLPINLVTLGLFTFVINALMLLLVSHVVKGFTINGFAAAFVGGLLLWLISLLTNRFLDR